MPCDSELPIQFYFTTQADDNLLASHRPQLNPDFKNKKPSPQGWERVIAKMAI
jgi:hypothetical protein